MKKLIPMLFLIPIGYIDSFNCQSSQNQEIDAPQNRCPTSCQEVEYLETCHTNWILGITQGRQLITIDLTDNATLNRQTTDSSANITIDLTND